VALLCHSKASADSRVDLADSLEWHPAKPSLTLGSEVAPQAAMTALSGRVA